MRKFILLIAAALFLIASVCVNAQNAGQADTKIVDLRLAFAINSKTGEMSMTRAELKTAVLSIMSDGKIDPDVGLISYTIKAPGFPAKVIGGDKLEPASDLISRTGTGDYIVLYDPKTSNGKYAREFLEIRIID